MKKLGRGRFIENPRERNTVSNSFLEQFNMSICPWTLAKDSYSSFYYVNSLVALTVPLYEEFEMVIKL